MDPLEPSETAAAVSVYPLVANATLLLNLRSPGPVTSGQWVSLGSAPFQLGVSISKLSSSISRGNSRWAGPATAQLMKIVQCSVCDVEVGLSLFLWQCTVVLRFINHTISTACLCRGRRQSQLLVFLSRTPRKI